jgi:hypothetical protein
MYSEISMKFLGSDSISVDFDYVKMFYASEISRFLINFIVVIMNSHQIVRDKCEGK